MKYLFLTGSDNSETRQGIHACLLDTDQRKISMHDDRAGELRAGAEASEMTTAEDKADLAALTWLEKDPDRDLLYTGGVANGQGMIAAYRLVMPELDKETDQGQTIAYEKETDPARTLAYDKETGTARTLPYEKETGLAKAVACRERLEASANKLPRLHLLGALPVTGGASCHQALDGQKEFLAVSFYESGSLSLIRLDEDGIPVQECCHIVHTGHSVHPKRQRKAHVHFCCFLGNLLYCCDLGEDRIYEYQLHRDTGTLTDTGKQIRTTKGAGPRHLVWNPQQDLLYVVTEMGGSVCVFSRSSGTLLQEIASLPEEVDRSRLPVIDDDAYGAAIHWYHPDDPASRRILVSNRGHDSITIFQVQPDGLLQRLYTGSIHGHIPRDFGICGRFLICANQASDDLTVMEMNEEATAFHDTRIRKSLHAPTRVVPL